MKICIAGTFVFNQKRDVVKESKYLLESFYSIQDWQIPLFSKAELFLLDSGAFTFLNNTKKGNTVDWNEYVNQYADFINKHHIKHFFELDIDGVIGYEEVRKLTRILESKTNRQCIPVWHKKRGISEWKRMVSEYSYVAIGGIVTKEIRYNEYKNFIPMLQFALKKNCKVHGLGFTRTKELKKYPFYSVDSTSWTGINRFNSYDKYASEHGYMIRLPKNGKRIKIEKREEAFVYSFREWIKFQKYAERCL